MYELLENPVVLLVALVAPWIIVAVSASWSLRSRRADAAPGLPAGADSEDFDALLNRVATLEKTLRKVDRKDLVFAKRMRRRFKRLTKWWVVVLGSIGSAVVSVVVHQVGKVLVGLISNGQSGS